MKSNIYIAKENREAFEIWKRSVELGLIPGETVSNRLASLALQDLKRNAYKLRKAGIKMPSSK